MAKAVTLFLCSIQLLLVHSQVENFECDGSDAFSWEVRGEEKYLEFRDDDNQIKAITISGPTKIRYQMIPLGVDSGFFRLTVDGERPQMFYCDAMQKIINTNLEDKSVTAIAITFTRHSKKQTIMLKDTIIPGRSQGGRRGAILAKTSKALPKPKLRAKPKTEREAFILKDKGIRIGGAECDFKDSGGIRQRVDFKCDNEQTITIGRDVWQCRIHESGASAAGDGITKQTDWYSRTGRRLTFPTRVLEERINEYLVDRPGQIFIKINDYILQYGAGAPLITPHKEPIGEKAVLGKPKCRSPKFQSKIKTTISYEGCEIALPIESQHMLNPYIMCMPDRTIRGYIEEAFPGLKRTVLDIYDYAIKDIAILTEKIAKGPRKEKEYFEFISFMDKLSDISKKKTTLFTKKKTCTQKTMMTIYETYLNPEKSSTSIDFTNYGIQDQLFDAAQDQFTTKETDPTKGAWKDAKDEIYGKIKAYFDKCIPLSSPHNANPRMQATPTKELAGSIIDVFKVTKDRDIQSVYDALVDGCRKRDTCENYQFISAMQYLKNICPYTNCDTEMMHVYRAYITGTINIPGVKEKKDMVIAAKGNFKTQETDPTSGAWLYLEDHIYKVIRGDMYSQQSQDARAKEAHAKESYYNELIHYNELINYNEYYDSVYDDVSFDSEYSNFNNYNGRNGNSNLNNYNDRNGNSNFNLMNPILMLTGLIFCLCFICAALLNVISCGSCYVFWQYQTKIGDDKTENDYEYNNNI
eukprot:50793_1